VRVVVDAGQCQAAADWIQFLSVNDVAPGPGAKTMNAAQCSSFFGSKLGWAVVLGAYLLWTHTGHVVYALPYLFLFACLLMHVFRHHHGHHKKTEITK
jgi:hypothetical protein